MRASRSLGILASSTAIALSVLFVASPASAATLPEGQRITVIEVGDTETTGLFYEVNPAAAASTPVGTPNGVETTGIDVNDDGLGYVLGYAESAENGYQPALWPADANTGALGSGVEITLAGAVLDECNGIDLLPDGTIIIACEEDGDGSDIEHVGPVTPDGVFTPAISLSTDAGGVEFIALAYNAVTGVLWGFAPVDGFASFTIDLAGGSYDLVEFMDENVYAADFDRNGQLFVSTDVPFANEFSLPALATVDPAVGAFTIVGPYVSTTTTAALIFVEALTVWGKPALAETGGVADVLPVTLGSALLLLAGAAFIATARIQRRTA